MSDKKSNSHKIIVEIPAYTGPRLQYDPPRSPLNIIHKDDSLILVDKPSGLLSVPGKAEGLDDCLQSRMVAQFPEALLVHRLDMDTSGITVYARSKKVQRHLGLQFERRHVRKIYVARVFGEVAGESGEIDLPMIVDWENRPLQKVCHESGRPARTEWRVLAREDGVTRVELRPYTGRSHQLRVHMLALGHPILGDPFYAQGAAFEAAPRLQLHSLSLSLRHPVGGVEVTYTAPCPF